MWIFLLASILFGLTLAQNETTSFNETTIPIEIHSTSRNSMGMWILVGIVVSLIVLLGFVIGFSQLKCSRHRWNIFQRFRRTNDDQDILEFEQPELFDNPWSPRISFS